MIMPGGKHLYIAGFMGTGKSTIGPLVAGRLGRPFQDLDTIAETLAGQSIDAIFQTAGEARFRECEVQALESIVEKPASVIALGGGAPTILRVAEIMQQTGWTVLLTANLETIFQRLAGDTSRPLLRGESDEPASFDSFKTKAETIMASRRDAYRNVADWTVDTSGQSAEAAADRIVKLVASTIDAERI